jgi:hypothetical protein
MEYLSTMMKIGMVQRVYKTPASSACSDNAMRIRRLILAPMPYRNSSIDLAN